MNSGEEELLMQGDHEEERMRGRRRITYSRESLLAVGAISKGACCDNRLLAGVEASMRDLLFIGRSSHHHHHHQQQEACSSGGGSGLLWRRKVTAASPDAAPSDGLLPPPAPESFQTGDGRAPKMCTRFFSTAGCSYGEGCRFLHRLPDSSSSHQQDVAKKSNLAGKMPNAGTATPASFGASASAKISVDASLAGVIIGRGGANIKRIAWVTGAKVAIRDHASDIALNNVELEGTFDQIKNASTMVMELVASSGAGAGGGGDAAPPARGGGPPHHGGTIPGSKFRTRLCEHFAAGSCFHGDRCRYAHGEDQLRSSGGRSDVDATLNFWAHDEFPSRKGSW